MQNLRVCVCTCMCAYVRMHAHTRSCCSGQKVRREQYKGKKRRSGGEREDNGIRMMRSRRKTMGTEERSHKEEREKE